MDICFSGKVDNCLVFVFCGEAPCRVVGKIDHHQFGIVLEKLLQCADLELPSVFLFRLPHGCFAPNGFCQFIQRLVPRKGADDVISGFQQGIHEQEDALFRSGSKNAAAVDTGVHIRNRVQQQGMPLGFSIGKLQVLPQGDFFHSGQFQYFLHGKGLAVRAGKEVTGGKFVFGEIPLKGEGFDFHLFPCKRLFLRGNQYQSNYRSADPRPLLSLQAFLEEKPGEQHSCGRIKGGQNGRYIETSGLGGHGEKSIPGSIENASQSDAGNLVSRRYETCFFHEEHYRHHADRSRPGGYQWPEYTLAAHMSDADKEEAETQSGNHRQAEFRFINPGAAFRGGEKPDRKEGHGKS